MELYIYDCNMELLGVIDEIKALVWTRRYWECGEFALLLPQTPRHAELEPDRARRPASCRSGPDR